MDALKNYNIDFVKLKLGEHAFDFEIDDSFFSLKENSLIDEGKLNVHLHLDKKERLMNLHFSINGMVLTNCDICLDAFELPVDGQDDLVVKIVEEPKESDSEIVYLSPQEIALNVYDFIYEIICTQIPLSKSCALSHPKPKPCNPQMLQFLSDNNVTSSSELQTDPRWDKLKNIKDL